MLLLSLFLMKPMLSYGQMNQAEKYAFNRVNGQCYYFQEHTSGYAYMTTTNLLHFCSSGRFVWKTVSEHSCVDCPRDYNSSKILARGTWYVDYNPNTNSTYIRMDFSNGNKFYFLATTDARGTFCLSSYRAAYHSGEPANCRL